MRWARRDRRVSQESADPRASPDPPDLQGLLEAPARADSPETRESEAHPDLTDDPAAKVGFS